METEPELEGGGGVEHCRRWQDQLCATENLGPAEKHIVDRLCKGARVGVSTQPLPQPPSLCSMLTANHLPQDSTLHIDLPRPINALLQLLASFRLVRHPQR